MNLFTDRARVDTSPAKRVESHYAFLDRAARPEYERIRSMLDDWFFRYPAPAAADLRGRFRSDNHHHKGAFFELFLHELLRRMGCEVEAGIPDSPDFHVTRNGFRFYVEATVVDPKSSLWASDPLEDAVLDALDEIDSPNFRLSIETKGKLADAPSVKEVVDPFQRFVSAHDPDAVDALVKEQGYKAAPSLQVTHGAWSLSASLMPKPAHRRGPGFGRPIGVGPMRGGFVDSVTPLRKALIDKAKKYRDLDAPYVVAVNAMDVDDRIDEMEALFGSEQFTIRANDPDAPAEMSRKPDGLWHRSRNTPHATGVNGALIFRGIAPWGLARGYSCLYLNPYVPTNPALSTLSLPYASAEAGVMTWHDGSSLGDIMNVPAEWPFGDMPE